MQTEKPIKKIFAEICDGKLTNLEIDNFITKATNRFKLPKLKRLIIDYEQFLLQEKTELLIYFEFIFGDREKFKNDGNVPSEETSNQIIKEYKKKYKNSPETIHSHCETESHITSPSQFSPVLKEIIDDSEDSSKVDQKYSDFISFFGPSTSTSMFAKGFYGLLGAKIAVPLFLFYVLSSKTIGISANKLTSKILSGKTDSDFTSDLKSFMESPAYHFYIKLHTLYDYLYQTRSNKKSPHVSQPSTSYNTDQPTDATADKSNKEYKGPEECARLFKKDFTTPYTEQVITFVMEYADKCDYDNIANLIREIRDDPECPDEIKDKNKDSKAERNWINYYYEKNKIPKGMMKKKLSRTSEN